MLAFILASCLFGLIYVFTKWLSSPTDIEVDETFCMIKNGDFTFYKCHYDSLYHVERFRYNKRFLTKLNDARDNIYCTIALMQFEYGLRTKIIDNLSLVIHAVHVVNAHYPGSNPGDLPVHLPYVIGTLCTRLGYPDYCRDCYKVGAVIGDDNALFGLGTEIVSYGVDGHLQCIDYCSKVSKKSEFYPHANAKIGM